MKKNLCGRMAFDLGGDYIKLYHGSNKYIENELTPHKSFHYKPLVYATTDFNYALLRAGKFSLEKIMLKEDYNGQVITLIELYPGALIDALDTKGYVYIVDDKNFQHTNECMENEYVNSEVVTIVQAYGISNVLKEIIHNPCFKLILYKDSDEYFKTVRGGREGYLQRRKERVEKLQLN